MPDATSIIATLAAIKNSIDVVKAVKAADYDLDKSILKEKIAILVDSLLEAKIQANETLDLIQEKDTRIAGLENLLKFKANLYYDEGVYLSKTDKGSSPYCAHCWEVNKVPVHLHFQKDVEIKSEVIDDSRYTNLYICPFCKNSFYYP